MPLPTPSQLSHPILLEGGAVRALVRLRVNGEPRELVVDTRQTLLSTLRDGIGLTGTKEGCSNGNCGACTVLYDGKPVCSCLVLAAEAEGHEVTTIEGLGLDGQLHVLQQAFIRHGAFECGFCTPGVLLAAKGLLDRTPNPSEAQVRLAVSGNLCRCTGYDKIVRAILAVVQQQAGG
ncbi:MAG: (2Fe-2S)-binding protein [Chloroflexi bacterium]|nr:(2Fe-2S)-binding protein [Chloroflexota bacterium]